MVALGEVTDRSWDVVVVGAGPAGSLAARQLALEGVSVLLVDRARLGRSKVCGCCLNVAALNTLSKVSLGSLTERLGAVRLTSLFAAAKGCEAVIPLPGGASLSRESFDAALVQEGIASRVTFLPGTNAALGECRTKYREVKLSHDGYRSHVSAKVVLVADGLGCKLLARFRNSNPPAEEGSRIGAGINIPIAPGWIAPGRIYMACSKRGYVGLVVLEDGRLNVAAAYDREAVRNAGGLDTLAASIVAEVGWPEIAGLAKGDWRGTAALTRRALRLSDDRVFVLGDAAGSVEPFTGEGMAWALSSAVAVVPLALHAVDNWDSKLGIQWAEVYQKAVLNRQAACRTLAFGLRHPLLVRAVIKLLGFQPGLARPVVRRLNAP